jgi:hypothetical protein
MNDSNLTEVLNNSSSSLPYDMSYNNNTANDTMSNMNISGSMMDVIFNYTLNITQNLTDTMMSASNFTSNLSESSDVTYYNPINDGNFTDDGNLSNLNFNNTLTNTTEIKGGCELLGNFGYAVQGILGIMCFSVLVCKSTHITNYYTHILQYNAYNMFIFY